MARADITVCEVVAETPASRAHFFGFHDVTPWNLANDTLLVLRVDPDLRRLPDGETAEVCLWRPGDDPEPIGITTAWNFQQGARAQWLPDGSLVYNVVHGGRPGAVRRDPASGTEQRLGFSVGAVDGAGRETVSPHYGRLARYWPAYGVTGVEPPSVDAPIPVDDGLWKLDLETNALALFLSVQEVASFRSVSASGAAPHFLTHPLYSPSGRAIAFLHRFFTADGAIWSRLVAVDRDGSRMRILAEEMVSHFCWRDDDTILVWTRRLAGVVAAARRHGVLASPLLRPALTIARRLRGGMKQRLAREYYQLVPADGAAQRTILGPGSLTADGHPMFHPGGRWVVTDTYPDSARRQALILFDSRSGRRIDIGSFHADPSVGDGDLKCDLHPRWDRAGRRICVDTTRAGVRQCVIVDAAPVLEAG